MSFEPSKKLQTILDMINEFVDRELVPMEHDFLEKGFKAMEPEIEKKKRHGAADGAVGSPAPQGIRRHGTAPHGHSHDL